VGGIVRRGSPTPPQRPTEVKKQPQAKGPWQDPPRGSLAQIPDREWLLSVSRWLGGPAVPPTLRDEARRELPSGRSTQTGLE
jgi:hypothetical protein